MKTLTEGLSVMDTAKLAMAASAVMSLVSLLRTNYICVVQRTRFNVDNYVNEINTWDGILFLFTTIFTCGNEFEGMNATKKMQPNQNLRRSASQQPWKRLFLTGNLLILVLNEVCFFAHSQRFIELNNLILPFRLSPLLPPSSGATSIASLQFGLTWGTPH